MNKEFDYIGWKDWQGDAFGVADLPSLLYFNAELKKLNIPEAAAVLEIGFGNGQFLAFGKNRGWSMMGTEANRTLVMSARHNGFDVYEAGEITSVPDGAFDLVAAFDVLEHVPTDEQVDFLKTLIGKLKSGGILLLRFPNADSSMGLPNQNGDPTHCSVIGVGKLKLYASLADAEVLYVKRESRPLSLRRPKSSIINLIFFVIFVPTEWLLKKVLFPSKPEIVLFSENIVTALQKRAD